MFFEKDAQCFGVGELFVAFGSGYSRIFTISGRRQNTQYIDHLKSLQFFC
jgi:hypothetical protein